MLLQSASGGIMRALPAYFWAFLSLGLAYSAQASFLSNDLLNPGSELGPNSQFFGIESNNRFDISPFSSLDPLEREQEFDISSVFLLDFDQGAKIISLAHSSSDLAVADLHSGYEV